MAKFHGLIKGDMKGNAGQLSFRQQGGMTIVSGRIYNNKSAADGASYAQREQRIRLSGVVNLYKAIEAFEKKAWEGKPARVSDYNMFVKKNLAAANVYFTKEQASLGACYPMRCIVSQGSIAPINMSWITENVTTDIALGNFQIESQATVGNLSAAIIANNYGYAQGDKITFGLLRVVWLQVGESRFPSVQPEYIELTLDTTSTDICGDVLTSRNAQFISANSVLAMQVEGDAAIIVHTREQNAQLMCSTQLMVLKASQGAANPYSTDEAKQAAADSYGYQSRVLIQPGDYAEGGDTPTPTPTTKTVTARLSYGTSGVSDTLTIHKDNASGEVLATLTAAGSREIEVESGTTLYFVVNPGQGLCTWTVDGASAGTAVNHYTLTNVTAAHSVSVEVANV